MLRASERPMTYPEKQRRTMGRLGLFVSIPAVIAAALTARFAAVNRDESAGRSAAFPFGTTNSPGVVGEFHYQMWKQNHLPAGSILKEINSLTTSAARPPSGRTVSRSPNCSNA